MQTIIFIGGLAVYCLFINPQTQFSIKSADSNHFLIQL